MAYSLPEGSEVAGLGISKIKEAITTGELPVVEIGKRVLVLDEDLRAYLFDDGLRRPREVRHG